MAKAHKRTPARVRATQICQEMMAKRIIPKNADVTRQVRSEPDYNNPAPQDIARGIKEFWDEHLDQLEKLQSRPDIPQPVFDAAAAMFETATQHATDLVAEDRKALAEERKQLDAEREELKAQQAETEQVVSALKDQISDLEKRLIKAQVQRDKALEEATEHKAALETRLEEERLRNQRQEERLEKLLEQAIVEKLALPTTKKKS